MATPVLIFKWLGELPDEPRDVPDHFSDDDGEQLTYECAYPTAIGLVSALRDAGLQCDDPFAGTLGWDCTFRYANRKIQMFINWTAIEYPPDNYIAIQWYVSRTWSELLQWNHAPIELEYEVQRIIDRALTLMSDVCAMQWLTDEQFDASYRRGEPLPEYERLGGHEPCGDS